MLNADEVATYMADMHISDEDLDRVGGFSGKDFSDEKVEKIPTETKA